MVTTTVQRYVASSVRQGHSAPGHHKRRGALGFPILVGVFTLLCMGAPATADTAIGGGYGLGIGTGQATAPPSPTAAIAVPNFITYRDNARVAAGVGTAESIRAVVGGRTVSDPTGVYGTDEEEDSEVPVEQDTRLRGGGTNKTLFEIGVGQEPRTK